MLIDDSDDKYETITTRIICMYHKQYPDRPWSQCTCRTLTERRRIDIGDNNGNEGEES